MEMGSTVSAGPTSASGPSPVTSTDLDAFLTGVYRYYCEKGLRSVIFRSVSNLIASMFTFILSLFVLLLIDWESVARCYSEEACRGLSFFHPNPISPLTTYRFIVLCQLVPLGLYTVVLASLSSVAKVREALRVSHFYKAGLGVSDDALLTFLSWEEIVQRIVTYQQTADSPLCIVQDSLTPVEITGIVMRTDNLLLQILKKWHSRFTGTSLVWELPLQSSAIQWVLQYVLITWLFSDRFRIRPVALTWDALRQRFQLIGVVSLALIGPIVIFTSILLFIKETDDVRANRSSLFDKDWTGLSKVVLRHYSEPEHAFSHRLSKARQLGELFSNHIVIDNSRAISVKTVKFIAGGVVAMLAIVAVVQDSALLYLTLFGRNLFWYFAVVSGIVAIAAGITRSENQEKIGIAAKTDVGLGLVGIIHYLPGVDAGPPSSDAMAQLNTARRLDAISIIFNRNFFKNKLFNLLTELASILALPVYFLLVFPETLVDIIIDTRIMSSENLGDFACGMMEGSGPAGASIEMREGSTLPWVTRDTAKCVSTIAFAQAYGANSGLSREQLALVAQVEKFRDAFLQLKSWETGTTLEFWYLLMRSVADGEDTGVVMSSSIISLSSEVTGVAKEAMRILKLAENGEGADQRAESG